MGRVLGALGMLTLAVVPLGAQEPPEFLISNFDRDGDARLWSPLDPAKSRAVAEPRDPTDLNKSYKVVLQGGGFGGISSYRLLKDWSPYPGLSFVVWSPDRRALSVRIDDENSKNYGTRYNGDFTLESGRNLVQIPMKEIGRFINPARVKALILFVSDAPKGLTLYFDDVRLGPPETDRVAFIPYDRRIELVPTTEVETPHFPLARPLAGGPLKALVVYDMVEGRDVSELMQRIDLQVSPVVWGTDPGTHKWIGFEYGKRSYDLTRRYLASTAQGPEKFDTLILGTPIGWVPFGKAARDALLDRVKNRGEGLVLVFPFPGEKARAPWPDDLRELSALIDSETDFQRESGWMKKSNDGHVVGKKWRAVKDHPILRGVPLDALPFEALEVQAYKAAPGAEVLVETENGHPVLAVKKVGTARVATFAVRSASVSPLVKDAGPRRQWRDYRYWEVFYDLLARAALWTAGRDRVRSGEPVALERPRHPDPNLVLKQWKNVEGKVTDWQLEFAPPVHAPIQVSAPAFIERDADLAFEFKPLPRAESVAYAVRLVDYAGGRRRTLLERPVEGAPRVSLPTRGLGALALTVEVEATAGGKRIGLGEAVTFIPQGFDWTDYEVYGWGGGGISYLREHQMRRLREFGLTCEQVNSAAEARKSFASGMRVQCMLSAGGMHAKDFDRAYREYSVTGDPKLLVRTPSFSDPAFLDEQRRKTADWTRSLLPFEPLSMSLGDETSLTLHGAEFDYDFHPENVKSFRSRLRGKFGDVSALNAAVGGSWESFDAVVPPVTAEARKSGNFGLWNEWREHNDDLWTSAFRFYRDEMKKLFPEVRLSVSGTQTSHVFNGVDWAKLAPVLGHAADYTGRFQMVQRLSFHPEIRSTPWAGYGRTGPGAPYQLWSNLALDGAGTAFFMYTSLLNPDYALSPSSRDYSPALKTIREGVGKQYLQTRRRFSPVALLWSVRSQRAAWAAGKFDEFVKAERAATTGLVRAGYDPYFISEAQVAAGELEKKAVRALVLPMTLSLGFGGRKGGVDVLPALERFLAGGGAVLQTHAVTRDEFLQPRALPDGVASRVRAFPESPDEVQRALESAGARPAVAVRDSEGKRMPGVQASLHAFPGAEDAWLLTLLRTPVGQKEVIGADGVAHMLPDPSGGKPVERVAVDVSRFGGARFFDIRNRAPLAARDGRLAIDLQAGDGLPLAVLPYGPLEFTSAVGRENDRLVLSVTATVGRAAGALPHVMRLDVIDTATGRADLLLSRNLLLNGKGGVKEEIPLALEDRGRRFEVRVTDILTGASRSTAR